MTELRASLRLQFHRDFTLDDAYKLVPYFARLGVSHIYASPILKARSGSMHGYDVVDPTCVNPELGGEVALERLVTALRAENMGLIVDFVPNHMAVGGNSNPWWLDVLEWGVASPYAHFFDIQWNSHDPLMKGQLLVPFLRTDYGEVLSAGEVTLHFDADNGSFYAAHYDHRFPISSPSYGEILRNTSEDKLLSLVRPFEALERSSDRWTEAQELRAELSHIAQDTAIVKTIEAALARYDAREAEGLQRLHRLLELQHYRIASWRTAADDINWRRFFDINDLGALRVERPDVFQAIHAKVFELIGKGLIDGLRIDHVDGLANPRGYCRKLRRQLDRLQSQRPGELANDRLPIFVEKILADGEKLPADWQVDGTTGYEFMNEVSLLQHDPVGELQLYGLWSRVSGRPESFLEEVRQARQQILASSLVGDFEMIAQGLLLIARKDLKTRDLTLGAIRRALFELIVHFKVYRTYAGACGRSAQDQHFFAQALADARTTLAESDWPLFDHLDRWLGGQPLREIPFGAERKLRKQILTRFQQLTSPTAAKAVEDTACYRSAALLSRNDVGFDPQHFSAPLADFHKNCKARAEYLPNSMLTTATHDHKRGEDTRARLAVLSERSAWFGEKVEHWHALANGLRTELEDGVAPSPGDELMLYQILLGTWPLHLAAEDEAGLQTYLERLQRWQEKAIREAKLRTNWSAPNENYESACREYLTKLMQSETTLELRRDIATAAMTIAPAGALNGLTQTLLRMTAPGFPDLYQGTEFWDFSLVDPDNRSAIDFDKRQVALAVDPSAEDLIENWRDGRIKQWLITQTLDLRQKHSTLFREGAYEPLLIEGEHADRLVAFLRQRGDAYLLIIAPRLAAGLLGNNLTPHISVDSWGETYVVLPAALQRHRAEGLFFTTSIEPRDGRIAVSKILKDFPVNILRFTSISGA
jgi:(1->4)-alpha-D-glucan 1-alpha-D-glucosylmutase